MKTVGIMCVRDEADLLPQVYPHIRERVDLIYAYDDGSQDATWDIIKESDYAIRRVDDKSRLSIQRPNYHHLLERLKSDFKKEEVWVFITMGDRFFLNKNPNQIVEEAKGYDVVEGIQLDFLRHRLDSWTEENDTWPDFSNIRHVCRWMKYDERCIVGFKLHQGLSYLQAKYPWPRGFVNKPQYANECKQDKICIDMPFLEHQGRRSPKAAMWRIQSGSRGMSKKYSFDYTSYASVMESMRRFYSPYRVLPWIDNSSLDKLVEVTNGENWSADANSRYFFWGLEYSQQLSPLPPRTDI